MADLETIGKIYINWLQAHRNAYLYHKAFIDMITKEVEHDWGIEYQLDETPPDYDHTSWQEYKHKFSQESLKAQQLYKDLLEQADLYIAKLNLEEIEDIPPDSNNNCQKLNEVIFELDELVNIAETQISQSNNGWISVDDELPKPEQEINYLDDSFEPKNFYLVQLKSGFIDTVYYATIYDDCEYSDIFISCTVNVKENRYCVQERGFNDYHINEVKYWQPMPEPPKK